MVVGATLCPMSVANRLCEPAALTVVKERGKATKARLPDHEGGDQVGARGRNREDIMREQQGELLMLSGHSGLEKAVGRF